MPRNLDSQVMKFGNLCQRSLTEEDGVIWDVWSEIPTRPLNRFASRTFFARRLGGTLLCVDVDCERESRREEERTEERAPGIVDQARGLHPALRATLGWSHFWLAMGKVRPYVRPSSVRWKCGLDCAPSAAAVAEEEEEAKHAADRTLWCGAASAPQQPHFLPHMFYYYNSNNSCYPRPPNFERVAIRWFPQIVQKWSF